MNNKIKHYKNNRKVILIKYNDLNEKLIIKKNLITTNEEIRVKVKCNPKIRCLKEKKRIRDIYSLSKVQLRRRIVPCCLRAECVRGKNLHNQLKRENYREIRQISKGQLRRQPIQTFSREKRNEVNNNDISSGSLTTSSDSEIESLIKSTRKRMRDSDKEWKMIPRSHHTRTSTPLSIKDSEIWISSEETNTSFDSLKTLILEQDDKDRRCYIKTEYHSPKLKTEEDIPESYDIKKIKLEPNSYNACYSDQIKIENCDESYYENAVITKLERIEDSPEALDVKAISIKQELYGDL